MIACTPIPAAATADPPPAPGARTGPLRNGNQRGNPNLAPRCGAKNRAGCPCRAPAMRNGRCRLHGGKCTGPRTQEGMASMIAAHTTHGRSTASARTEQRYVRTLIKRTKLICEARRLWPYLPSDMAARVAQGPDELFPPVHPPNSPFVTNRDPIPGHSQFQSVRACDRRGAGNVTAAARPLPRTLAAERQMAREEAAALAPWRAAIAFARGAKRAALAARRAKRLARRAARHARRAAREAKRALCAPLPLRTEPGLLEREFAARMARLRPGRGILSPHAATSGPKPDSAFPRINPLNPETGEKRHLPFFRINPMNRELEAFAGPAPGRGVLSPRPMGPLPVAATSGPNPDSTLPRINPVNPETGEKPDSPFSRIDPMNREPDACAGPALAPRQPSPHLSPPKAHALRTTTLSGTCQPDLRATLAARFAPPRHAAAGQSLLEFASSAIRDAAG